MKEDAADIVGVANEFVELPMPVSGETPQSNRLVICSGSDDAHARVEGDPVDSSFVALYDMLDLDFRASEDLVGSRARALSVLLLQPREVPDPDGLVERSTGNQRLVWVEAGAHHVVAVACKDGNDTAVLPVPESHGLIV